MEILPVRGKQEVLPREIVPREGASLPPDEISPWEKNTGEPAKQSVKVPEKIRTEEIVAQVQEYIDRMNVSVTFSTYGENKERISIAVIEKETGKVIREFPPEELKNLYTKMQELVGMIFSETA